MIKFWSGSKHEQERTASPAPPDLTRLETQEDILKCAYGAREIALGENVTTVQNVSRIVSFVTTTARIAPYITIAALTLHVSLPFLDSVARSPVTMELTRILDTANTAAVTGAGAAITLLLARWKVRKAEETLVGEGRAIKGALVKGERKAKNLYEKTTEFASAAFSVDEVKALLRRAKRSLQRQGSDGTESKANQY